MTRQKNDHVPIGELLTRARLDKQMTRAQVAKATGISENSLVRYEKAGIEEDGQYPPSPKLAKLCFELDISPLSALFGCVSRQEFWEYKSYTWENWLMDHPDHEYLVQQWFELISENEKLNAVLKMLLAPPPEKGSYDEEFLEAMKADARKIIELQDAFDDQLRELGAIGHKQGLGLSFPGVPSRGYWKGKQSPYDYAAFKKNGPVQIEPSRSPNKTNNPETAPTVSTKSRKSGEGG